MSQSRGFAPKNNEIFNKSGHGASIYNGFGTTRTEQSPTLFVTNLPSGVSTEELTALFASDFGFQQLRTVRHMIFVDFYDVRSSTASMRLHQNHKFEAFSVEQGIMIDYDKDPRNKRNRAFTSQVERGSYTHGLDHEPSSGYAASGATMATFALPASSSSSSSSGGGHYAPQKPRDATLDLINQMKQQHAQSQGVEVPLTSSEEHLRKGTHYQPQQQRSQQRHRQSQHLSNASAKSSSSLSSGDALFLPPAKGQDSTGVASLLGGESIQPKLKRKLLSKKKVATTTAATTIVAVADAGGANVNTNLTSNDRGANGGDDAAKRAKHESDAAPPGLEVEREQPENSGPGEGGLLGLDYGSDED